MREEFREIYDKIRRGEPARRVFLAEQAQYVRNFRPKERLIILGCGHVAQPVCRYGAELGFAVTAVDDRPFFANHQNFPAAEQVVCDAFAHAIEQLHIHARDYVVVVTRGHRYDAQCLRAILPGPFPRYLGMIGSKRRVAGLRALLREEGFDPEKLDRIHAPIGLSIGAETVNEIGISIVAELIQCRRQAQDKPHGSVLPRDEIDLPLLQALAEDPTPKALMTVFDTSGSTPVKAGAMMAVDKNYRAVGTIGGGCGESTALMEAYRLIGTGEKRCITVNMTNEVAEQEGMVCGGRMQILIEDFTEVP